MLPLMIDLTGRKVVIFGGGAVGARKARFFRGECQVVVVSRAFHRDIREMDVERVRLDLRTAKDRAIRDLVEGAFLVIAAAGDPSLNNRIRRIARARGILCNSASGTPGDVIIPSVEKGRSHLVAVTTFGRSPAMARYIREQISGSAGEMDRMIDLQVRVRKALRAVEPSQERRSAILSEILGDREAWAALADGEEAAWKYARGRYLHG